MLRIQTEDIEAGWRAVDYAKNVRRYHAKRSKRGSSQREDDIKMALDRIKQAMDPIRRFNVSASYGHNNDQSDKILDAAKRVSLELQRERMKLWKMRAKRKDTTS